MTSSERGRWCPNCRGEFRLEFSRCPECDVELVDEPPVEVLALPEDETAVYDLSDWFPSQRTDLEARLREEGVPFAWRRRELTIPRSFESVADDAIDDIDESGNNFAEPMSFDEPAGRTVWRQCAPAVSSLLLIAATVWGAASVFRAFGWPGGFEEVQLRLLAYGFGVEFAAVVLAASAIAAAMWPPITDRRRVAVVLLSLPILVLNFAYGIEVALGRVEFGPEVPVALRIGEALAPLSAVIIAAAAVLVATQSSDVLSRLVPRGEAPPME